MTSTCAIATTKLPNVKINRDTLISDRMVDGEFFTTIVIEGRFYAISLVADRPVLMEWAQRNGCPVELTLDGKTIHPGDVLRGEHGRKFQIKGAFWQLDTTGEPKFVDC